MDRNQLIGIVLITILFSVYLYFSSTQTQQNNPTQNFDSTTQSRNTSFPDSGSAVKQQAIVVPDSSSYGSLASFTTGTEKPVIIENNDIKIQLSSKGGMIQSVLLKNYLTYDKKPLYLNNENNTSLNMILPGKKKPLNLSDLYFDVVQTKLGDTSVVLFKITTSRGDKIEHEYKLGKQGFKLMHKCSVYGFAEELMPAAQAQIIWNARLPRLEYDAEDNRNKSTVNYYTNAQEFNYLSETSTEEEKEDIVEPLRWVAFKNKFFNSSIISESAVFSSAQIRSYVNHYDTLHIKELTATLNLPLSSLSGQGQTFGWFFGPNKYAICKNVTEGFEENVYLGWPVIKWINRFVVIPVFNVLENSIGNYGIIIIILVFLIKLLLLPLSFSSYKSMAKMKVMKPEIDELREKYGDDMQKFQQEQMKLFQQVGINPLSGCIPVLLQMPILFAMFSFFPTAIELRQQKFLWADDLSTFDHVINLGFEIPIYGSHVSIFTLLMTLSTLAYTWYNNQISTVQGPMKVVSYTMPVVFMFILNRFPAGLSFYYLVSNLVTIGQQAIIRKFVDEEQIKIKLEENRKASLSGSSKKSKFMQRLEDAMKAQEEMKKKKQR
ncbi:MAG: membrane protein insertase YidC [Cytophagaceae bacterium]|nr:membrane protein insertase YidC [Cytophagaceae bacterium]MDW8456514.1 membrane protein insertase YidC [Cytophagaceae bacterium]